MVVIIIAVCVGEMYRKESFSHGKEEPSGIYVSITLPSLNIGTVGGGTSLATQKECLNLIGCYGSVSIILTAPHSYLILCLLRRAMWLGCLS